MDVHTWRAHVSVIGILLLVADCADHPRDGGDGGPMADAADTRTVCGVHGGPLRRMPNPATANLPNPASYTDLGDGTVLDDVSCLVWQREVPDGSYTWTEANDFCRRLPLGGGGWRLPSRIELVSLVDFAKAAPGPTIDLTAFPNTPPEVFWSASMVAATVGDTPFAWYVLFATGATADYELIVPSRVRCVQGPSTAAASDRYQIAAGEVLDRQTGLVWQQTSSATKMSWTDAQSYCAGAWRVPSVKELQTLVDETRSAPAADAATFADLGLDSGYDYWSSSAVAGLSSIAWWYVDFEWGENTYGNPASLGRVRCVR
jgi:hypothetical protein